MTALQAAASVSAAAWTALAGTNDPFIRHAFFATLEAQGAAAPTLGWQACHLALGDPVAPSGLLPLYARNNAFGDFVRDWSWADAFQRAGLAYYPKLVSGVPYTPVRGRRLWATNQAGREALVDAALRFAEAVGASSWHVAFPVEAEAALLAEAGLLPQYNVQFHWFNRGYRDFDDYLAIFTAEKRRKVRAERRKVREAGIEIRALAGDTVSAAEWLRIHALYADTFRRYGNYPALSVACLAALGQSLGPAMQVMAAFRDETLVAVALCFVGDGVFYGRYWGAAEAVSGLHFELCYYQGIDYCIRHGLQRFEPGAGGEHKLARGFEPVTLATWHWVVDSAMRETIRRHLLRVDTAMQDYRAEAARHLPFRADSN